LTDTTLYIYILSPKFTFSEELKVIDVCRLCSDIFTKNGRISGK